MTGRHPGDATTWPAPPRAARRPTSVHHHGVRLDDEYAWMHDATSPEVVDHLAREEQYAQAVLGPLTDLRTRLADELRTRATGRAPVPPTRHGPYWYYTRRPAGRAHLRYLRAPVASWRGEGDVPEHLAGERTLLDGSEVEAQLGGFALGAFRVSPGGWVHPHHVELSELVFAADGTLDDPLALDDLRLAVNALVGRGPTGADVAPPGAATGRDEEREVALSGEVRR